MEKAPGNTYENEKDLGKALTSEEKPIIESQKLSSVLDLTEDSKWYKDYSDIFYEKDGKRTAVPVALMQFVYINKYDSRNSQSYSKLMQRGGFAAPELLSEYSSPDEVRDLYRKLRKLQDSSELPENLKEVGEDFQKVFRAYLYSQDLEPVNRFIEDMQQKGYSPEEIYSILLKKSVQVVSENELIAPGSREKQMKMVGPVVNLAKTAD